MLSVVRLVSFWRCIPMQYNCQKSSNFQGLSHFSRIFGKNDKIPGFFQAGKTVTIFPGAVGTLMEAIASTEQGIHTMDLTISRPFSMTPAHLRILKMLYIMITEFGSYHLEPYMSSGLLDLTLNPNPDTHNRTKVRGGGLALICKSHYKVKTVKKGATPSFEYAVWELAVKNRHITITGIYHPPYSIKNRITNKMFIDDLTVNHVDDFTEFSTELLTNHSNNIILGDFN